MVWVNDDGLRVKFGVEEAEKALVTEISTAGGMSRVVEIVVNHADLPAVADNSVMIDDSYVMPSGTVIDSIRIVKSEDFVGAGATFNLGIADQDGGSNVTDVDALIEEATIAELNAGGEDVAGWIGTLLTDTVVLSEDVYLTWEVNTAAITAGEATIRVSYSVPKDQDDTLVWTKP